MDGAYPIPTPVHPAAVEGARVVKTEGDDQTPSAAPVVETTAPAAPAEQVPAAPTGPASDPAASGDDALGALAEAAGLVSDKPGAPGAAQAAASKKRPREDEDPAGA